MVEHKAVVQSTFARNEVYKSAPAAFLLLSSISFDSSVAGIFWTLLNGGKLCLLESNSSIDLFEIEKLLHKHNVSHFLTLPSLHEQIINANLNPPASLKTVIVAGEKCPEELPATHFHQSLWKQCELYNEYGPTEATVWSTVYNCKNHISGPVSIGKPIPHRKLYIMNDMQHVPVGAIGELYIGGGLARGYLNQPELTRKKFIDDPFDKGNQLYRTGDLVRWLACGNIEFIGRSDSQVKIRGYRIELGEIESCLLQHNDIEQVVVLAPNKTNALYAYIVSTRAVVHDGQKMELLISEIKSHVKSHLPDFMRPQKFIVLEQMPLTANGKIDVNALPAPHENEGVASLYVKPGNKIEEELCDIWKDILKKGRVGITDNFFDLGGHSLQMIKIVSVIREKLHVEVPVKSLFNYPTIEDLALCVNDLIYLRKMQIKESELDADDALVEEIIL